MKKPHDITQLESIINACKKNDRTAQEHLYNLFASRFYGICLRYGSDQLEAEDMLQEGFVKLFRKIDKYNSTGSFPAWASRLITNNCIDMLRKKPSFYNLTDEKSAMIEANSVDALDDLFLEDLVQLIQELPNGYRTIFNLFIVEGFSHKEIAEKLAISEGTSKSQLNRAKKLLQSKISEREAYGLNKKNG